MKASTARRLSRGVILFELFLIALMSTALALTPDTGSKTGRWAFTAVAATVALVYTVVGSLIVSRDPRNRIGLLFVIDSLVAAVGGVTSLGGTYLLKTHPASGVALGIAWFGNFIGGLAFVTIGFVFLLFPDGRAPTPRWRAVGWAMGIAGTIAVFAFGLTPDPDLNNVVDAGIHVGNPVSIGTQAVMSVITGIAVAATLLFSVLSVFAIRGRYKRGTLDERQQIRWLAAVGTIAGAILAMLVVIAFIPIPGRFAAFPVLSIAFAFVLAFGIPIASTVAIIKYHLYDLDVVIKKTAIALVVTLVFAGIGLAAVATIGQPALWRGTPRPVALAIGIAFGFLVVPMFRLSRRIARRIVYGKLADPYDVLARFSGRVGESYDTDDVLARMATILGEATSAETARVWLLVSGSFVQQGTWPPIADIRHPLSAPRTGLPDFGAGAAVEVFDRGELLGALTLDLPANDPMDAAKSRLIGDLASQAGLVLRNVKLIEELRASRQRLVAAQDEERRKLERNLHDGAQQQLVALAVQLKLARQLVDRDAEKARTMLDTLQGAANDALEDLRDLARGIYPPLLADKGLGAAIEAQARKAAVPTTVEAVDLGRYPQDVESAVYFSVLEALNNVAKYASASRAVVALSQTNGELSFEVRDDGAGFDAEAKAYGTGLQGMRDRLDAIGGGLRVDSSPGAGTTVTGHVPVTWGDAVV